MIRFSVHTHDDEEYAQADWRLRLLAQALSLAASEHGYDVQVTSVFRTQAETERIYRAAGLEPPASSVHGAVPCRGVDLVPVKLGWWTRDPAGGIGPAIAEVLNECWSYGRGKKCVLWHSVGSGAAHWHVQVPWYALGLLSKGGTGDA